MGTKKNRLEFLSCYTVCLYIVSVVFLYILFILHNNSIGSYLLSSIIYTYRYIHHQLYKRNNNNKKQRRQHHIGILVFIFHRCAAWITHAVFPIPKPSESWELLAHFGDPSAHADAYPATPVSPTRFSFFFLCFLGAHSSNSPFGPLFSSYSSISYSSSPSPSLSLSILFCSI